MNRFSRGPIAADVQSNFMPLPIDAIAKQIERKQGQYDMNKAQLEATEDAVLSVKGFGAQDAENLKKIQQEYNAEIGQQVESVGGDYSQLGGIVDTTRRKLKTDLTQGRLAAINNNLAIYSKQKEQIDKLKASGTYGDRAEKLFARDVAEFKGSINEDGTFNTFSPRESVKQTQETRV